jgi:hypothetical protein
MNIDRLKNFNVNVDDVDSLVEISAFATGLAAEYLANGLDKPEWLDTKAGELRTEIKRRQADARAKEIKEIELKLNSLKTAQEKRDELTEKLARLKAVATA